MGETPDAIREEIEETRGRMGETAEALAYKADVKSRVKDAVGEKVSRVTGGIPDGRQLKSGAQKVGISTQNPLGMAIAGVAAGFIVGTLLPSTRIEDERMGEMSDQVVDQAKQAGQEVAQEAVQSAKQTVQERGSEQTQELASSLREQAGQTTSGA